MMAPTAGRTPSPEILRELVVGGTGISWYVGPEKGAAAGWRLTEGAATDALQVSRRPKNDPANTGLAGLGVGVSGDTTRVVGGEGVTRI